MSKCEIKEDQSENRVRGAMWDQQGSICKQDQKSKCEIKQRSICKQDQKGQCEINKDQSAHRIRRSNLKSTKINLHTGSEDQM
jgi:hypothetical protein